MPNVKKEKTTNVRKRATKAQKEPAQVSEEQAILSTSEQFGEKRYEIRLSGSGGHGLVTAGVILGEAIAIGDGKNAVVTQSYGPEARGGRTRCDIVISDEEVSYPEAVKLDLLVALTQEASDAYMHLIKNTGLLIVDSDGVKQKPKREFMGVSFLKSAKERLGTTISTNIAVLGFIAEMTGIVTKKSLENVVEGHFAEKYAEKNRDALKLGYELAKIAREKGCQTGAEECLETEIDRT